MLFMHFSLELRGRHQTGNSKGQHTVVNLASQRFVMRD